MFLIEENLYQGGYIEKVPDNIKTVVSLMMRTEYKNIPYSFVDVPHHIWLPIEDGAFPGLRWLNEAVSLVENSPKDIFIHCRGGVSRSVMLTAAVLMKKYIWNVDKAMERIALSNNTLDCNMRFMIGLKDYYRQLTENE